MTTDTPARTNAHPRYLRRTVEWGNWGITFLDVQPDHSKNFGIIIGRVGFPIGTRGPVDMPRAKWLALCAAWTERGELPALATVQP